MQPNFTNTLKFINLIILSLLLTACDDNNNNKSNFTITADTIIEPNSQISKYVTQDEVDSFSFRYSDIHCDKENNSTLIPLRNALENKDTSKVLKFLKDNNLSADIKMLDGRTPIMYSAFYNDINTTKELINLGANIHIKDRYKLNALAYAVSINSADTVKVLLDNNLTIEETPIVQMYGTDMKGYYTNIDNIVIDGDNLEISYSKELTLFQCNQGRFGDGLDPFLYVVKFNAYETAKVILESGYIPTQCDWESNTYGVNCYNNITKYANHKPMLNLLLEHNVSGQPSKELLKKEYEKCYENYVFFYNEKEKALLKKDRTKEDFRNLNITLNYYTKHCSDKNRTFNVKEFISWKNDYEKYYNMFRFLRINKENPTKVIYIDSNKSNR